MAFEFKLPDIGEGIHEGEIVKWFVKAGDEIDEDDVLAEVQNDKAVVEIPSPVKGKVSDGESRHLRWQSDTFRSYSRDDCSCLWRRLPRRW